MNLVSLLFTQGRSLQDAVDATFDHLMDTIERFESLAHDYQSKSSVSDIPKDEMHIIIGGLRSAWVGNLYWQ